MTVLVMETASAPLRGMLSRWFLELRPGVFVGNVSAAVRAELQKFILEREDRRSAVMIFSAQSEQGFSVWMAGYPKRRPTDYDGLILMTIESGQDDSPSRDELDY